MKTFNTYIFCHHLVLVYLSDLLDQYVILVIEPHQDVVMLIYTMNNEH